MMFQIAFMLLGTAELAGALSAPAADVSRGRLQEALSSPSGKLTFSPEVIVPETQDPTALLLLANGVQTVSSSIRQCKSNAAFLRGSLTALQTFRNEQEGSRGNFPGPIPVIYGSSNIDNYDMSAIAAAGAEGLWVSVAEGTAIASVQDLETNNAWASICQAALQEGVQPVPEVTISQTTASEWGEDAMEALVAGVTAGIGAEPVCMLLTIQPDEDSEESIAIPTVPRELAKRVSLLGSVQVPAGDNRLNDEAQRFKSAGYTGAVLRHVCLPGHQYNPDLQIVASFWAHCIGDLKSTKSKSFSFRSKNNMEKNVATQWANYQKNVIDSGALGAPEDSYSVVNDAAGEYKGFA